MIYPGLVTLFCLFMYSWLIVNVGRARERYHIQAPAVIGNADFERYYRVQMNTLEQLVLFLPALWLFAEFLNPHSAAILGLGWLIGRILYAVGDYKEASNRAAGFIIALLFNIVLLLGATWGIVARLVIR